MRAVLDPNVLISALLTPAGLPAELLRRLRDGQFEAVISPKLIVELERVLGYPKISARVGEEIAAQFLAALGADAIHRDDPGGRPPIRSADPDDDYLIALVRAERVALVSGDRHLLALAGRIPVFSPRQFREILEAGQGGARAQPTS